MHIRFWAAGMGLLFTASCGAAAPASSPAGSAAQSKPAAVASASAKPAGSAAASGSATAKPAASASAKPVASGAAGASAAPKQLGRYKFGASAINSNLLPIQLGVEHGLYTKYGATVDFNPTGLGNTTVAAMQSGEIAAAFVNPSNVAEAVAGGSDVRSVMSISNKPSYLLVVTPDISKPEDLKGKSFAVANPGGQANVVAEVFLSQYGLKHGQNITLINLGTEPTRVQAVQSGQVAATIINPTFKDRIGNLKILLDLREQSTGLAGASLAIAGPILKNQPDAAEAFVKGTWEGIKLVVDPAQKDKVIAGFKKYLQIEGPAAEEAYKEMQKDFQGALPPKLDPAGLAKSMQVLSETNPALKTLSPDKVIDSSIVDRLIAQGFK